MNKNYSQVKDNSNLKGDQINLIYVFLNYKPYNNITYKHFRKQEKCSIV